MALRKTINQIQAQARDKQAAEINPQGLLREWWTDLSTLFSQIRADLKEFEDDGSITFRNFEVENEEKAIGRYNAPALMMDISGRLINVAPIARLTPFATGRVDFYRGDRPGEADRLRAIRTVKNGGLPGHWEIEIKKRSPLLQSVDKIMQQEPVFSFFDKSSLEEALDYLLSA